MVYSIVPSFYGKTSLVGFGSKGEVLQYQLPDLNDDNLQPLEESSVRLLQGQQDLDIQVGGAQIHVFEDSLHLWVRFDQVAKFNSNYPQCSM